MRQTVLILEDTNSTTTSFPILVNSKSIRVHTYADTPSDLPSAHGKSVNSMRFMAQLSA